MKRLNHVGLSLKMITISNADTLDDEIGVNQSQFANVNIDGEKSDENYDFMIGDDDVESELMLML